MPEHVHLLVSEPDEAMLSKAIQALKIAVARRAMRCREGNHGTLWQKRYYDHNVRSHTSFVDKLGYIHRNPVKRGLVAWYPHLLTTADVGHRSGYQTRLG
jgi:putative transposase